MALRTEFVLLLLTCATLAGCVGPAADAQEAPPEPVDTAAPPESAELGALTGTIVDAEGLPIGGVTVAILETLESTRTDTAGAFRFDNVEPGSYRLAADRLGYESTALKADVQAGQTTEVSITLTPLIIKEAGYTETHVAVEYYEFNWYYLGRAAPSFNNTALARVICEVCAFIIPITTQPEEVMTETLWTPSIDTPATNQALELYYCVSYEEDCTLSGVLIWRDVFSPRQSITWSGVGVDGLKGQQTVRLEPLAGFPGAMVAQRVNIFTTFAIGDDFPGDFTALPPIE